jgi:hypothetical protein
MAFGSGAVVAAQTPAPAPAAPRALGTWFYGISAGGGRRSITGSFLAAEEPPNAGQPPSRTTGEIDLDGGMGLGHRLAALGLYERSASFASGNGWGTFALHGVIRGWVTDRVWVEGGVGPTELAFRTAANAATRVETRWWSPGVEAAGGYEIFQGPTVSLQVFVRYAEARFDGVRQQNISFQVGLIGRR